MTQQNSDTVYGVPKAEWLTMTPAQMRQAKRQHNEAIRDRNREATSQYLAELDARKQAQSDEAARERDERTRQRVEGDLRRAFIAGGGTSDEFESRKDALVAEHLDQQALAHADRTKRFAASRVRRSL